MSDEVDELWLKVWRLHPHGCPIAPAERTLRGTAPRGATRFCGPFTHANRAGWWLFPPVDIDITWRGGSKFDHELHTPYPDTDHLLMRFLLDADHEANAGKWLPRTKFTWGLVEPGVVQVWTGCIFQTPPGWGLHLRSPINCPSSGFHVMEAMLETDWLQYDIWLNLAFHHENQRISLRKDAWPPIAQIVPTRREAYHAEWQLQEQLLHRRTPDANSVFEYYVEYNEKKFASNGRHPLSREDPTLTKESTTYYRERRRLAPEAPGS